MSNSEYFQFKKGENIQLSKNFSSNEMQCKCKREGCSLQSISKLQIKRLQELRDKIGPIKITSAFRCREHNKAVGGSIRSQHLKSTATDIVPLNVSIKECAALCEDLFDGVGVYKTFIHLDSRGTKARWKG